MKYPHFVAKIIPHLPTVPESVAGLRMYSSDSPPRVGYNVGYAAPSYVPWRSEAGGLGALTRQVPRVAARLNGETPSVSYKVVPQFVS